MGFESESSCEEPEAIKIETTDEDYVEPTTDDNESNKQDEKTHMCTYEGCNKKFSRPSKLQAHLCYHTGERAFKCEHKGCDKSYSRPQHLRRHIVTSHNVESKYKKLLRCPYPDCMKELSNQQNLKKHYYRKHERKHPFTCDYCEKGFPKHQQLKQHLYHHTGIPPFRCSECNMGFTKIGDLNRHNRGHKTYTCSFAGCGVVLKAWTHMRTHIKLKHPSEFTCDDCGRTFRTKSRLKIHATIHKEPHERETFPCTYPNCPRFYFKKSNLTHHIKSSHEGKKFECTYDDCDRQLCSKQKLEQHMKLHRTNRPISHRKKKSKNKRCDTGTHKRSMAVKLSGVKIPYQAEKMLLNHDLNISEELDAMHSSPSQTLVVLEKEKTTMSIDGNFQNESLTFKNGDVQNEPLIDTDKNGDVQNESLTDTIKNGDLQNELLTDTNKNDDVQNVPLTDNDKNDFSEGDVENSVTEIVVTEKEQAHGNENIGLVNYTHDLTSFHTSPVKEIEPEFKESRKNVTDKESDRLVNKTEVILITVPFDPMKDINKSNPTSKQHNGYHEVVSNNHLNQSNLLNSNENINIPMNLDETSNIFLFDLNPEPLEKCDSLSIKSMLNVPLEDEICSTVMCINSDHGTLLQEVDAASAENRKSECLAEETKLLESASGDCSEREYIEKESDDITETKLLSALSKDSLRATPPSKVPDSNKRKVTSNRRVLAHFKKLKTIEIRAKKSSKHVPQILNKQEDELNVFNCIYTPKEESHTTTLDTIYKEDKYIQDCLRVIDAKELKLVEERSKILNDIQLCDRESESGEIQKLINNRQVSVTEVDKNIIGILDASPSLKQNLLSRRKQKSLDQIVHSLHSVLENKLGGNNPSVHSTVELDNVIVKNEDNINSKYSQVEYSKSCQESSNSLYLSPKLSKFCVGDSKSSECSVANSDNILRDLCALSKKAILERTEGHEKSPVEVIGDVKQEGIWKMSVQGDMTIKKWLQLMQKAMEDVFPSLAQNFE